MEYLIVAFIAGFAVFWIAAFAETVTNASFLLTIMRFAAVVSTISGILLAIYCCTSIT